MNIEFSHISIIYVYIIHIYICIEVETLAYAHKQNVCAEQIS